MTENTQTTAQRIQDMLDMNFNFYPGPPGVTAKTIAAEIDRLTAEAGRLTVQYEIANRESALHAKQLAEARANLRLAEIRINGFINGQEDAAAEVERLRPAAEAWIAYDDYMMCPEEHEAEKFPVWVAAHKAAKSAQVARAAKERKP